MSRPPTPITPSERSCEPSKADTLPLGSEASNFRNRKVNFPGNLKSTTKKTGTLLNKSKIKNEKESACRISDPKAFIEESVTKKKGFCSSNFKSRKKKKQKKKQNSNKELTGSLPPPSMENKINSIDAVTTDMQTICFIVPASSEFQKVLCCVDDV